MTEMEKIKEILSLSLLLLLLQICIASTTRCSPHPDKTDLSCYSDLNSTITCVWNSTSVSNHKDSVCKIDTQSPISPEMKASCVLQPVDFTTPSIKKCSMVFNRDYSFTVTEEYSINLNCGSVSKIETKKHKPFCHVKVKAPRKPSINSTTMSWLTHTPEHLLLNTFASQLEWKQQDQSWSDPLVKKTELNCEQKCEGQLDPEMLIQGETYEARVRVQALGSYVEGIWSDWSPTLNWVSSEGRPKPPSGISMGVWNITIAGAVAFVLISIAVFLSKEKTVWIYVVKKITGPPVPNPSKSTCIHKWSSLLFTSESIHSCSKDENIASLEITPDVDVVQPIRLEEKILEENLNYESSSSGFSNPSYSALCLRPLALFSQTSNDLLLCTPSGPAQGQQEIRKKEMDNKRIEEAREKILKSLLKDTNTFTALQVSDYEKVEHFRQQSVDSSSCEEVGQADAEADCFTLMDGLKEGALLKKEWDNGKDGTINFHQLFGSSKSNFDKHSIQVCLDYERVSTPHANSPELPSLDSGFNSTVESQEEIIEVNDKSTHFPFPCSSPSFLQHNLNSFNMIIEPSSNGYMPVRQEKS